MKNFLFLFVFCFLFFQCEKEAAPLPDLPTDEETTLNLMPEPTFSDTAIGIDEYSDSYFLIDTIRDDRYGNQSDRYTIFSYNQRNQLIGVNLHVTVGRSYRYNYDERGRLIEKLEYATFNNRTRVRRDSITYDERGRIYQIHDIYDRYPNDDEVDSFLVNNITEFIYNQSDQVVESKRYHYNYEGFRTQAKYFWEGNNILQMDRYDIYGKLYLSFRYQYDNQPNYIRNHPYYYTYWHSWSKNNVIHSSATDYSGLYDASCYECEYEYEYDAEGRVTFSKLLLFYQPPRHYISYRK